MQTHLHQIFKVIHASLPWMSWNLFLALLPLGLSVWLFRWQRGGSLKWWLGVIVFVAFLPNAPYVLTDAIHLPTYIEVFQSIWLFTLVILPLFLIFILTGFEAYVISLINVGYYLHRQNRSQWILAVETVLHGLSAIGVYLGRFIRLNSWDLVTKPHDVLSTTLDSLTERQPLFVTMLTFLIISGLYVIFKFVTLAIATHRAKSY
jgi:uncharacterized membrane protein